MAQSYQDAQGLPDLKFSENTLELKLLIMMLTIKGSSDKISNVNIESINE